MVVLAVAVMAADSTESIQGVCITEIRQYEYQKADIDVRNRRHCGCTFGLCKS